MKYLKTNFLKILLVLLLFTFIFSLTIPHRAYAQINNAFGGRILFTIPCTCSLSLLLVIGPPKGGLFLYIPFVSTLHEYYTPRAGVWALGTARGRSQCLQYVGVTCTSIGSGSIIRRIGTSLF